MGRIERKEKRLKRKRKELERTGKVRNHNVSDVGSHYERTLARERAKLFEKYFGKRRE